MLPALLHVSRDFAYNYSRKIENETQSIMNDRVYLAGYYFIIEFLVYSVATRTNCSKILFVAVFDVCAFFGTHLIF